MAVGRPSKYRDEYHPVTAFKLALLGLIDREIAEFLEINEDTLHQWKKDHPVFSESLNEGKLIANGNVAQSLYKRANGMVTKEVVYEDIEERIDHGDGTWHYEPKTRVKTHSKRKRPIPQLLFSSSKTATLSAGRTNRRYPTP